MNKEFYQCAREDRGVQGAKRGSLSNERCVITPYTISMPRQSLAEEYYLKAEETPEEPGVEWLLLHDFEGLKPSTRFWTNLKRLKGLGGRSSLIQYSVLQTDRRRVAVAAKKLAEHYGADTIRLQARVVLKEIELTHTWGKTPSMRVRNLTYMAERSLGVTVPVNPVNTSQICSGCGCVVKKDLSVRTHCCPRCGLTLDRDVNAARNILRRGIGLERPESTLVGEETYTRLGVSGRVASMNQEATLLVGW